MTDLNSDNTPNPFDPAALRLDQSYADTVRAGPSCPGVSSGRRPPLSR
jgi:hypothetical protein